MRRTPERGGGINRACYCDSAALFRGFGCLCVRSRSFALRAPLRALIPARPFGRLNAFAPVRALLLEVATGTLALNNPSCQLVAEGFVKGEAEQEEAELELKAAESN